jgi:hypothetical protein
MGPHFCARSSFNQHRNERGCVATDTPQRRYCDEFKGSSEEASRCTLQERRAGSRRQEGKKAMLQYEAESRAVREKTARLRALRLDKAAAEKNEGVAAGAGQPLVARKKAKHGC